ncbi:tryptophan synthase subunit alpha [Serinicoccus chungangensis]|uniref:Tryptophan synthase alpha chain n=1 Tax=Serinicoccus chungangensis TaxID=767452 RepID=A0A0W8I6S2_9MICO|nr:tryptophan synthase subunit alpha [Serinicoccus chungangensis]KUG54283.1 tryptophan synthase subunit alpha [Serinicoccus chungangensis]
MSALDDLFAGCRAEGRSALVGYLPAGYPDLPTSLEAIRTLAEAGADVIEVGVPYTDPLMDGPVVERAASTALRAGFRLKDVFTVVAAARDAGAVPVVMTYWNPVLRYGVDRFAQDLADAGGAGLITPDLIPDEAGPWRAAAQERGLAPVFLVAPSSTDDRLRSTTQACRGFVYVASTMGVTGVRDAVGADAERLVQRTRAVTDLPLCVGLGVSTGDQAAQVAAFADGVIVGSALVRALGGSDGLGALRHLTEELAAGVRRA